MRSPTILGCSLSLAILAASALPGVLQAQSGQAVAPRISERVDENRLAVLSGNTRPEARAANDRGIVSPDMPMPGMVLVLRRSQERQAAFDAFVESQYDVKSPNFHRWLTPDEIGQKFGPAQADLDTLSNWLLNHGFSVDSVSKDRMAIHFSGNAATVQSAFHTEIHHLEVKGVEHIANMSDPKIPAALAPVVVGVEALHNFFPHPLHTLGSQVRHNSQTGKWERIGTKSQPASSKQPPVTANSKLVNLPPQFNTGGTNSKGAVEIEDLVPYDIATIYNILPLWNASSPIDGKGQTIAIVGTSDIDPADVQTFRAAFGLPAYSALTGSTPGLSIIHPNVAPGDCSTGDSSCIDELIENSLDVEWSGAVAKNANIVLVASSAGTGSTYTADPVYVSSDYIVQNKTANIMNVSYGECELELGTAGNAGYNALWQTAASEGIAVFVASGDEGAASCDAGGDNGGSNVPYGAQYGLSVSGVASTPWNVAVGGTDFQWQVAGNQSTYWSATNNATNLSSALGYIPEYPWNDMCTNSYLVSSLNSANSLNLTAAEWCNDIGTGYYTFGTSEDFLLSTVDTVGGSGGQSSCTVNDGATVASCKTPYPKPSWQTGVTGLSNFTARAIPDVSFFASNGFSGSAYVICVSVAGACTYSATTEPTGEEVGGTSVASPVMAGVMALINERAGSNQGNPNSILYGLAAKEAYSGCSSEAVPLTGSSCSFNDIDTGTISTPCAYGSTDCTPPASSPVTVQYGILSGYNATTGYDAASGLGSLNVANVINAFAATIPAVGFSPTSLTFANTLVGSTAATQTVTLTNTGGLALAISGISITGADTASFSQTNNCPASLAVSKSCSFTVTFKPTTTGTLTAFLTLADNETGSPQTLSLTGVGYVPTPIATLAPTSLTFASTLVGSTAATQASTLTNTGTAALAISGITVSGANASSFSQTNNCPASLAIGANCSITVTFKPASSGTLTASVSVADNATGSPQTVALTGVGTTPVPIASLSPTSLTFSSTPEGTAAATQTVTLSNTGAAPLVIGGITVTGTNASSFSQTNNCTASLAAGANCSITVTFTPAAVGSLTASISVADNAAGSPQTVSLTGTGAEIGTYTLSAAAVTISPGSTGTSAITATGTGGYMGPSTVTLSACTLTGSPSGATDVPTCAITSSTVTFASGSTTGSGGSISILTTAASSSVRKAMLDRTPGKPWAGGLGAVAAAGLLLMIPGRLRRWRSLLGAFVLVAILGVLSGCGGGGSSTISNPGTSAGTYTFTVNGADAAGTKATATVAVTVN